MVKLDAASTFFLSLTDTLESYGASEWNQYAIIAASFGILLLVRATLGKRWGIDWYALLHALVSGIGGFICVWLDLFASEKLTGIREPLRALECADPLTPLHRILPAITCGYSLFDIIDGIALGGLDFLAHGLATFSVMLFFIQIDRPQLVVTSLNMEVSTIFLDLVKCELFNDFASLVNQMLFMVTFFVFRIVVSPRMMTDIIVNAFRVDAALPSGAEMCYPRSTKWVIFSFCSFFCLLNAFWMYKIARKAHRKLTGKEGIKSKNDLTEKEGERPDKPKTNGVHTNGKKNA